MQAPTLYRYANGGTTLSHSMRYCIEYELWAADGIISPATLQATLGRKYQCSYSKPNLVTRLTELVSQGKAARLARGLYVHADHEARVRAAAVSAAPTLEDLLS